MKVIVTTTSYASSKLRLTDLLTGVKCRATSVAKNLLEIIVKLISSYSVHLRTSTTTAANSRSIAIAQTALPWEFSGSRDSSITILISLLKSSPIAPMVKVRLLEMSKAERTKLMREVSKESKPIRRPELIIGSWPSKVVGVGSNGEKRNLKEQFSISWNQVTNNLWHLKPQTLLNSNCSRASLISLWGFNLTI